MSHDSLDDDKQLLLTMITMAFELEKVNDTFPFLSVDHIVG